MVFRGGSGGVPLHLALLRTKVWVHCNTIRELRVQPSSSRSVPSIGHILLHTGVDNGSSQLLPFPSQSWGCGP